MSWNYEEKLIEYIAQAQRDSGLKDENGNDYIFEVCTEEIFAKKSTLLPNTIYVVIKYLSTTNTLNAITQPIQLIVMCEQNQIQASQIIFSKLVASHNFETIIDGGTYVKQDYREPVVLSNFNEVSYGYRTIMYISATLFVMDGVIDVNNLKIKVENIAELTDEEIVQRDNVFDEGNYETQPSVYFYLKTDKLKQKILEENANGIGMYCYASLNGEIVPKIEINGVLCSQFVITTTDCVLKNGQGDNIEIFSFAQTEFLTFRFMPWDDEHEDNEYCGHINDAKYFVVFPDIVTQKLIYEEDNVKPINFNIAYSMTPNTQPIPPQRIATSVKSLATFSISFSVPMISSYGFINVISKIAKGEVSGNLDFIVSFTLGSVAFTNINMKLISTQITTAINEIPGLQIGLLR